MTQTQTSTYTPVSTQPVKRFFVEMLTRDIALEDAILDLLDNCVDGVLRRKAEDEADQRAVVEDAVASSQSSLASEVSEAETATPYAGFWAHITVNGDQFSIADNCGGIPWSEHDRAFRMGRPLSPITNTPDIPPLSVGTYGIGMKRAIFKLGDEATIRTQHKSDSYEIEISPAWIAAENLWDLPVYEVSETTPEDGTTITVGQLHAGVKERLGAVGFKDDLLDKVQSHYAVLLTKGFEVKVNDTLAVPRPITFRFSEADGDVPIRPYMFRSEDNGVSVFLAVGLREPIPDAERLLEEQSGVQFSSEYAGWTVICNDRVVLYCNRDEQTGWGTARVPRYHTQFIAISGVVEFRGDASLLPTTTTKRGLDFSSALYQRVLDRMREGTRLFVDYTNDWKARQEEAKAQVSPVPAVTYPELKARADALTFTAVRVGLHGEQYRPKLPQPPKDSTDVRISYFRDRSLVMQLAEELVGNLERMRDREIARSVGEHSFDLAYQHLVEERADR